MKRILLLVPNGARRAHEAAGDDCVLQAAVFEAIFPEVNNIAIPAWVLRIWANRLKSATLTMKTCAALFLCLTRLWVVRFGLVAMCQTLLNQKPSVGSIIVLSVTRAGYEAMHYGQIHLVGGVDRGFKQTKRLCDLVRAAAVKHARRGWIILDAHSHGICLNGELLFDFASRPLSARGLVHAEPQAAIIKRGPSLGGRHPGGWECIESPTMVEIDNWGGYSMDPDSDDWNNPHMRASAGIWGYDQCSWFARLSTEERHAFLRYAHRWCRLGRRLAFAAIVNAVLR